MRKIYKKNNISIKCIYIDDMIYYTIEKNHFIIKNDNFWIDIFWQFGKYNASYIDNLRKIACSDCNVEIIKNKEYIYDCLVLFSKQVQKIVIGL